MVNSLLKKAGIIDYLENNYIEVITYNCPMDRLRGVDDVLVVLASVVIVLC